MHCMMKSITIFSAVLGLTPIVSAHMLMSYPPSLRFKDNPNVGSGLADFNLVAPLHGDGSDFPCKGYQSDLGTAAGKSVVDWAAGASYNFTIIGGASHGGGSCQASLSYDKGKTFTVIHSFIGNCPTSGTYNFNMPSDAPAGAALFAWTWYNKIGNREIYMNCASITVTGSGTSKRASTSFSSRPSLFVANLQNGCTTVETMDVTFPDPGPDVTGTPGTDKGFGGNCKAVNSIGGGSSGSSSPAANSGAASPVLSSSAAMASSSVAAIASSNAMSSAGSSYSAGGFYTATSSATAATSTSAASNGLSLSADGSCGGNFGCKGSVHGGCCSQWGYCGSTDAYCGTGCNPAFGTCGSSTNSTGSAPLAVSTDKTCGGSTSNTCQGSTFGNCCSQFGYCGSTSDYCSTGCQAGFGSCVLGSGASNTNASSALSTATTVILASSVAPSITTVMPNSNNSVAPSSTTMASGFIGVTNAPSSPSSFTTVTRTSSTPEAVDEHTVPPSLRTSNIIVPTTPSRFRRYLGLD